MSVVDVKTLKYNHHAQQHADILDIVVMDAINFAGFDVFACGVIVTQ